MLIQKENDLSAKDIVKLISSILTFLKIHFWKLSIVSLLGGCLGFFYAFQGEPVYPAKIRFVMKDASGSSALMSSLGSLGSLIGGASGSASPLDKTLAVMGSERIVSSALLSQMVIANKSDLAINHFIRIQKLHEKWKEDTLLNGILFEKNIINIEKLDYPHRKAFREVLNILIGKKSKIILKSFDKKSGVFELIVNNSNEEFSIGFNKLLFKELEQFLYKQSVLPSSKNVLILNNKIDSIKNELNSIQNTLARNTDRTLGLIMQEDKVEQKKLLMKEQMLTIMYGEAQKNYETFKFMNESINPGLELLEIPFTPIRPAQRSKIIFSIIGFLSATVLCFGFLFARKWIQTNF